MRWETGVGMLNALKKVDSSRKGREIKEKDIVLLEGSIHNDLEGSIHNDLIEYLVTEKIYIPSISAIIGEMMTIESPY